MNLNMPLQIRFGRAHLNIKVSGSVSFCKWELAEGRKREQLFFVKKAVAEPKLRGGEVGNWTDLSCIQLSPHTRCLLYLEPLFSPRLCVARWCLCFSQTKVAMASLLWGGRDLWGEWMLKAADGLSRKVLSSSRFYKCHLTQGKKLAAFLPQELSNPIKRPILQVSFVRPHNDGVPSTQTPTAAPMQSCDYSSEGIDKAGCLTGCHWAPGSLRLHKLQTISLVSWKGPAPCSKHKEVCFPPSPTQTKWVELTRALLKPGLRDVRISPNLRLELLKMRLSLKMV